MASQRRVAGTRTCRECGAVLQRSNDAPYGFWCPNGHSQRPKHPALNATLFFALIVVAAWCLRYFVW